MPSYLIEAYLARGGSVALAAERVRRGARATARTGAAVRYVRTTFVPEDELCTHVLEAPSAELARDAARRGAITYERIVEAVERVPRVSRKATRARTR